MLIRSLSLLFLLVFPLKLCCLHIAFAAKIGGKDSTWSWQVNPIRIHIHIRIYIYIWRFPKMGIPRNHPLIDGFSSKNHQLLGTRSCVLGNPHIRQNYYCNTNWVLLRLGLAEMWENPSLPMRADTPVLQQESALPIGTTLICAWREYAQVL